MRAGGETRQTRQLEVLVGAIPWRFKSSPAQIKNTELLFGIFNCGIMAIYEDGRKKISHNFLYIGCFDA